MTKGHVNQLSCSRKGAHLCDCWLVGHGRVVQRRGAIGVLAVDGGSALQEHLGNLREAAPRTSMQRIRTVVAGIGVVRRHACLEQLGHRSAVATHGGSVEVRSRHGESEERREDERRGCATANSRECKFGRRRATPTRVGVEPPTSVAGSCFRRSLQNIASEDRTCLLHSLAGRRAALREPRLQIGGR